MLITSLGKIILHMPKCAGSSVRWALLEQAESLGVNVHWFSHHAPLGCQPKEYKTWPSIGFVRNPLYWYASWYTEQLTDLAKGKEVSAIERIISNDFTTPFNKFLDRALNLTEFFKKEDNCQKLKNTILYKCVHGSSNWYSLLWPNLTNINPDYFKLYPTLYSWWIQHIGIEQANEIYRIEDGVKQGLQKAFPVTSIQIKYMNKRPENKRIKLLNKQIDYIELRDQKYFTKFNYMR